MVGSGFYLGSYSAQTEKMTLDMKLGPQTIEWGYVDRWVRYGATACTSLRSQWCHLVVVPSSHLPLC